MKNINKFPKITVTKEDNGLLVEVEWPERILPKSQYYEDSEITAWGYEIDYDGYTFKHKVKLLFCNRLEELSQIDTDLLLIIWDKKNNNLKAFTSYTGMFPLYFAREGEIVTISPDFFEVFKTQKTPKINKGEALDYILQDYLSFQTENTFIEGVYKLLPACVLEVTNNLEFNIKEGLNFQKILDHSGPELDAKDASELIESTLSSQIKKRLKVLSNFPFICEMSSGFDCIMVAYLLQRQNKKFRGFSFFTSLNSDDSDPQIVSDWAARFSIPVDFMDSSDIYLYGNEYTNKHLTKHFFPASHGLELAFAIENKKVELYGENLVSFTGDGGDEFFYSADLKNYLSNTNKENQELIKGYSEGDAKNIFSENGYYILNNSDRIKRSYYFPNTFSDAMAHQLFFPVFWLTNTIAVNPYDSLDMLKLSQRLPKDMDGHTMSKQEIYRGNTDAFIDSQYRTKLPYHEQVYLFLDQNKDKLISLMERSVLGKADLIQSENLLRALKENRIKDTIGISYLMFNNACRLEMFLQKNNVGI